MDFIEISITDIAENILVNVTEINESVSVTAIEINENISLNITEIPELVSINIIETVQQVAILVNEASMGLQGPPGATGNVNMILGEQPSGLVNGSNATFTTSLSFQPGKLAVYINGLLQKIITHYQTIGTQTILFTDSPQVGDQLQIDYIIL